ncbi:MAG: HAD family phosphatase [Sedimentisphaerales bacterium]|nr:HAD family phosphatase [Sedimentisphaerales bacterium]
MLKAVIFDFDGVICDSEMLHFEAFNRTVADYDIKITKEQYFADYLGLNDKDFYNSLIEEDLLKIDLEELPAILALKKKFYEDLAQTQAEIIDGVPEFLKLLNDNNIAMAICSGALLPEIEIILNKSSLLDYFPVIVSAEQVEKGKPAPDGFLLALERLNCTMGILPVSKIAPDECIAVEDSCWGLEAAKAAGMKTIAITNSYPAEDLKDADLIVDNLSEITLENLREL